MSFSSDYFICSQVSIPTQWFETGMDTPDEMERRTFTLYADRQTGKFIVDSASKLREFWIRCIQPIYYTSNIFDNHIVHYKDTKSNPRRIHPFAIAFISWYNSTLLYIMEYIGGKKKRPIPVLICGSLVLPRECIRNFRRMERGDIDYLLQPHIKKLFIRWEWMTKQDVEAMIIKIQSMFRRKKAIRHANELRLDPDILFCKETLYYRLSKVGVDKTYHTMLEGSNKKKKL